MIDDNDDDYIVKLYQDFIESLDGEYHPNFDRDDLLEIHDYANDMGDGYVSFMSLSQAINLYPGDVELSERLALYFYQHQEPQAARQIIDKLPEDSFIRNLLMVAVSPAPSNKETGESLSIIISDLPPKSLDDEAVIRLMDVVCELELNEWAYQNYDKLKVLAEYPDTLMNEMTKLHDIKSNPEFQLKVLEDFTTEFPFNLHAWLQLSTLYLVDFKNQEMADNALAYALAINPMHYEARIRQLDSKFRNGADIDELIKLTDQMLVDFPIMTEEIYAQKGLMYHLRGKIEDAETTIKKALKEFPRSYLLNDLLFGLGLDPDLDNYLAYRLFPMDSYEQLCWEERLSNRKALADYKGAGMIASFLSKGANYTQESQYPLYMECMYRGGKYQEAVDYFNKLCSIDSYSPTAVVRHIYLLSLKKLNQIDLLREILDNYSLQADLTKADGNINARLEVLGIWFYIVNLKASLDNPDINENTYDPYI